MVTKVEPLVKWIGGKWVKIFDESQVYTRMKPSKSALDSSKAYIKMESSTSNIGTTTKSVTREVGHARLPEGMLPEELTSNDISKLITARYNVMRHSANYKSRIISTDLAKQLKVKSSTPSLGVKVEETGTMWTYRKPNTITDNILDFKVLPVERISMSVNAHPDIINVLDGFIARGEIIVNGKLIKTMQPPKAYYKITAEPLEHFVTQSDPITMYFREPITKEQLEAIKIITEPFKGLEEVSKADKLFHSGKLKEANWLSFARENTPEDLYKSFKRAQSINPELAQGVYNNRGTKVPDINLKVYGTYDTSVSPMVKHMENYRYRISAGQQYAINSFIDDYFKAIGKAGFDRMT